MWQRTTRRAPRTPEPILPPTFAKGAKKPLCYAPFSTRFENINQAQQFNTTAQSKQTFQMPFASNPSWSPSFLNSDRIYAENRAWRGLDKNFALC
jgi:hypothetical protein